MADIGKKLKNLREKRGIKRRDAARSAEISYDYLAKIENGHRSPNLSVLSSIAHAIGTTVEAILSEKPMKDQSLVGAHPRVRPNEVDLTGGHIGPPLLRLPEARPVPRIGWARAGRWDEASDAGFEPGAADDWVYTDLGGKRAFSLRVEGDSMEPEFFEGEIIVVDPDRAATAGDFVIAKIEDENEATFKQLKYRGDIPILHPLNPKYPDIETGAEKPTRIVGVIVEKKTFFGEPDEREIKLRRISDRVAPLDENDLDRVLKALDLLFS